MKYQLTNTERQRKFEFAVMQYLTIKFPSLFNLRRTNKHNSIQFDLILRPNRQLMSIMLSLSNQFSWKWRRKYQ